MVFAFAACGKDEGESGAESAISSEAGTESTGTNEGEAEAYYSRFRKSWFRVLSFLYTKKSPGFHTG